MNPAIARRRHAKAAAARHQERSPQHQHGGHDINVGQMERQVSLIGGGILAAFGLLRGSLSGLALAAVGGALVWRGYTGHCEMYHLLGHSTADNESDAPGSGGQESRGRSATADVAI